MKQVVISILMSGLTLLANAVGADVVKIINVQLVGSKEIEIQLENPSDTPISDLKFAVACGCIKLLDRPTHLESNERKQIRLSVMSVEPQRKETPLIVTGSNRFQKQFLLVNYFLSDIPFIAGNSIIELSSNELESSCSIVLLGSDKLTELTVSKSDNVDFSYHISDMIPLHDSPGCYKREVTLNFDRNHLLSQGHKKIQLKCLPDCELSILSD